MFTTTTRAVNSLHQHRIVEISPNATVPESANSVRCISSRDQGTDVRDNNNVHRRPIRDNSHLHHTTYDVRVQRTQIIQHRSPVRVVRTRTSRRSSIDDAVRRPAYLPQLLPLRYRYDACVFVLMNISRLDEFGDFDHSVNVEFSDVFKHETTHVTHVINLCTIQISRSPNFFLPFVFRRHSHPDKKKKKKKKREEGDDTLGSCVYTT